MYGVLIMNESSNGFSLGHQTFVDTINKIIPEIKDDEGQIPHVLNGMLHAVFHATYALAPDRDIAEKIISGAKNQVLISLEAEQK